MFFRIPARRIVSIRFVAPIVALLIVSVTVLTAGTATEASAGTADDELTFVRMINELRGGLDLPALSVDTELTAQARSWSAAMADADNLAHAPDMTAGITAPWTVLGENVGVNASHDIGGLFDAFVASPSHYQNLVDPRFQYLGVGVAHGSDGKLWTTHRFMATTGAAPTASPPTTPTSETPTTEPPTTQAPTTQAPTTAPPTTATPTSTTQATNPPTSAQPAPASTASPADSSGDRSTTSGTAAPTNDGEGTIDADGDDTGRLSGRISDGAEERSAGDLGTAVVDTADLVDEIVLDVELIEQVLNDVAAVPF